jgi:hypothetical protein
MREIMKIYITAIQTPSDAAALISIFYTRMGNLANNGKDRE